MKFIENLKLVQVISYTRQNSKIRRLKIYLRVYIFTFVTILNLNLTHQRHPQRRSLICIVTGRHILTVSKVIQTIS